MDKETEAECFDRLRKDAEKNADPAFHNIVLDVPNAWILKPCDKCMQLTNHDPDGCLKCRAKKKVIDSP